MDNLSTLYLDIEYKRKENFIALNHNMQSQSEQNTQELIWQLQEWGISYLSSEQKPLSFVKCEPTTLIRQLAQCEWSRVQDASVALFLLHPEIAPNIIDAYHSSSANNAEQIVVLTLAALYMQRKWSVRLTIAFGHSPALPEELFASFWQERNLPSPDTSFEGIVGLESLEHYEQERKGWAYYQGDWQNQMDHLLYQEDRKQRRRGALALHAQPWEAHSIEQVPDRPEEKKWITAQVLNQFLVHVNNVITTPCTFYLADEAMMAFLGIRPGLYIDFDSSIEESTGLWEIEAQEQVSLDFIQANRYGYPFRLRVREHPRQLETYGSLTIYGMDILTIAFHKLWRASTCDIRDLCSLVQGGWTTLPQLDKVVQSNIVSSDIARRVTIDEKRLMRSRYRKIRAMLPLYVPVPR